MRKCNCVVLHNDYKEIFTILVLPFRSGGYVRLLENAGKSKESVKRFDSFNDLYGEVLSILNQNDFYVNKFYDFDKEWYEIQWINIGDWRAERETIYSDLYIPYEYSYRPIEE